MNGRGHLGQEEATRIFAYLPFPISQKIQRFESMQHQIQEQLLPRCYQILKRTSHMQDNSRSSNLPFCNPCILVLYCTLLVVVILCSALCLFSLWHHLVYSYLVLFSRIVGKTMFLTLSLYMWQWQTNSITNGQKICITGISKSLVWLMVIWKHLKSKWFGIPAKRDELAFPFVTLNGSHFCLCLGAQRPAAYSGGNRKCYIRAKSRNSTEAK